MMKIMAPSIRQNTSLTSTSMALCGHAILILIFCASSSASAFTTRTPRPRTSLTPHHSKHQQRLLLLNSVKNDNEAKEATANVDVSSSSSQTQSLTPPPPPPPLTTTRKSLFQIREAQYSDLAQAANLMTDGFYPELRNNPILRPIRYLLELERLQGNFPYEATGRHFYLVAHETIDEGAGGTGTSTNTNNNGDKKVIGFCDIDGRIPKAKSKQGGFLFSPFATTTTTVNRPQPYFSDLSVHPDHRRQGVASALMSEAEHRARTIMGFEELYLGVRSTNELALQMYSNIGYESIEPSGDILAFLEVQKDVRMLRRSL